MLSISDNGVGLAKELKKQGSLGMTLIETLSEQLDGTLSITSNNGLSMVIMFRQENLYIKGAGRSPAVHPQ
jgi:two-component sensor histidine kinase